MIALIILIFVAGYIAIAFEHSTKINKAAPALITGVLCWTVYILFYILNKGYWWKRS